MTSSRAEQGGRSEPAGSADWQQANQAFLMAAVAMVRETLEYHVASIKEGSDQALMRLFRPFCLGELPALPGGPAQARRRIGAARAEMERIRGDMPSPAALDLLCAAFALSDFERDIVLLCAGIELDSGFAACCAAAQGSAARTYPTFSLALSTLPGAHWSALSPERPLRNRDLITVEPGGTLTTSPLRIDERILHHLTGVQCLDQRLRDFLTPARPAQRQGMSARHVTAVRAAVTGQPEPPIVQLCGRIGSGGKEDLALAACAGLGLHLHVLRACDVPGDAGRREALFKGWERETILGPLALLVDCEDAIDAVQQRAILSFAERGRCLLFISTSVALAIRNRTLLSLDLDRGDEIPARS